MKIKAEIIKIYKSIHTWTGIICGLFLFIAFYAGALSVFKEPIRHWATPPVSESAEAVALEDMPTFIKALTNVDANAAKHFYLYIDPADEMSHQLVWSVKEEGVDELDNSSNRFYSAIRDSAGEVSIEPIQPARVAEFIDVLHRVVGLPLDTGIFRLLMGLVAALYFLALLSGLIIHLPVLVKSLFVFRTESNEKRLWLDAHNIVGVFSLPFHIIIALTAFVFAYHDAFYDVQDKAIHGGELRQAFMSGVVPKPDPNQTTDPGKMVPPLELLATAKSLSATFSPYTLEYSGITTKRANVRVWGRDASAIAPRFPGGFVPMNPYTGVVQTTEYLQGQQGVASMIVSSFFALHMATYGGNTLKWIYFMLGLAGAWLFFTGNLLWLESRRKRQKKDQAPPEQAKDAAFMAALTVGVSLGCISGISLLLASSKWLALVVEEPYLWYQTVYYIVFFSCIAWAFVRGAARSLIDLLWFSALSTFAIPLTSILALVLPSLGMWTHLSLGMLAVDVTALVAGFCFVWMARLSYRRVYDVSLTNSIWSYMKPVCMEAGSS